MFAKSMHAEVMFFGSVLCSHSLVLLAAVWHGDMQLTSYILDAFDKADLHRRTRVFSVALYLAAYRGNLTVLKLLQARCSSSAIDPNSRCGILGSPFKAGVRSGNASVVSSLIDQGADVNTTGGIYGRPLHLAAFVGILMSLKSY